MSLSNRINTGKIVVLEPIEYSYFQLSKSERFNNIVACSVFKSEAKFIDITKATDDDDRNSESFFTDSANDFISAEF